MTTTVAAAARAADPYGMAVEIVNTAPPYASADTLHERQVLALTEEAGELLGAVRRHLGYARRAGDFREVAAEAADVHITTHVTAVVLGISAEVFANARRVRPRRLKARDTAGQQVLALYGTAALAGVTWLNAVEEGWSTYVTGLRMASALADVLTELEHVVAHLGIDLQGAVAAKADVIFSRGWMDPR